MALPASGSISLSQVNTELSKSATATISLNDTDVRALAGIASGTISLASLWGKSVGVTKGYFAGGVVGTTTTLTNDIIGITFSNETIFDPSAVLAQARETIGGSAASSTKGYWVNGFVSGTTYSSEIDGILFSSQTAINPSAAIASVRLYMGSVYSTTKAYFAGGKLSSGYPLSEIEGLQFSTDTAINPSAALALARSSLGGSNYGNIRGYFAGGEYWTGSAYDYSTEIDGIDFSTEALYNPSAALPAKEAAYGSGFSNSAGYYSGDLETYKLIYSTETSSQVANAYGVPWGTADASATEKWYSAGGYFINYYPSYYIVPTSGIRALTFSTDTTATISAALPVERRQWRGLSGV